MNAVQEKTQEILVFIDSIKFYYKSFVLKNDKSKKELGKRCDIKYRISNLNTTKNYEVSLRISSLWVDDFKGDACKAYMITNPSNINERRFYYWLQKADNKVSTISSHFMKMTAEKSRIVTKSGKTAVYFFVRYGTYEEFKYNCNVSKELGDEDFSSYRNKYTYLDSKQEAYEMLFKIASDVKTIGGLINLDMSKLDDETLEMFGFEKILDVCGNDRPMWRVIERNLFSTPGKMYTPFVEKERMVNSFVTRIKNQVEK